jgi:D-alanyl-D-alanine carboxypeptidase (penicillin-binding protein 5/6)
VGGPAPVLAWPAGGEAAIAVTGLGGFTAARSQVESPIASIAKLMTAYLVLRDHPLGPGQSGFVLTVSAADVAEYDARAADAQSVVPVVLGERLSEFDLLEALLVPSANNAAVMLAIADAGSQSAFVAKMNAEAKLLDMARTHYSDPSGFAASTVSTAADQLRLAKIALADPVIARIVALRTVALPVAGVVSNYDHLLGIDGFVGAKTGSDSTAGGCFVFADVRRIGGRRLELLGVVLGLDRGTESTPVLVGAALGAARRLADSLAAIIRLRTVLPSATPALRVANASGTTASGVTTAALQALAWPGARFTLSAHPARLGRSLPTGATVGEVAGAGIGATPVRALGAVAAPGVAWRLRHLL